MQEIVDFIWNNWAVIATALLAISEVLALMPNVKTNGIFQFIVSLLKVKK